MPEPPDGPAGSDVTEDGLLGGAVRLLQPRRGHRAGTDAVLLAGLATATDGDRVVDLGSASGAVGLMIAARAPGARLLFVERSPDLAALCRRNIALNGLADRADAVAADVFGEWPPILQAGTADMVATNPPFFPAGYRASPDPGRRDAHVMRGGGLSEWIAAACRLLRSGGRLWLINRAESLPACLAALPDTVGSIAITPVQPRAGEPASRIILSARKGGRAPALLAAPLVLHGPGGGFSPEVGRIHQLDRSA